MPDTGPPYNLRYPELADAPNVPLDIKNLADDVAGELTRVDGVLATGFTQRINTFAHTTIGGAITTTETILSSLTTSLELGRTYRLSWVGFIAHTVPGDAFDLRIREDSTIGTQLQFTRTVNSSTFAFPYRIEAEYTAIATASKTLVVTLVRASGSGSATRNGAPTQPIYTYVDYIRG